MPTPTDTFTRAFPNHSSQGMTLRDYFAAALPYNATNDLPNQDPAQLEEIVGMKIPETWKEREAWRHDLEAAVRYSKADAMMRRRDLFSS